MIIEVSVIMPAYNSSAYIDQTIRSVLYQSFPNWELIIVDDGSQDETPGILADYASRYNRIKTIFNKQNLGPALSRNEGIRVSKGRYITFLDSDDFWDKDFLTEMYKFISQNEYVFVFSSYNRVKENGEFVDTFNVPQKVSYKSLLKTCPISCLTALYDSEAIGKFYMPDIKKRQDYALWLEILKLTDYAYGYQKPLASYRFRKGSISNNKFQVVKYQWNVYRKHEKLSVPVSLYYLIYYAVFGLLKYRRLL
jgi:glycosyltransferase involved in cell wall biosynthesis